MNKMSDTTVNNKRIAKNTLMLYVRMLLLLVINLYTSRVILRELGVDDYGIYNVVGGIIVILSFLNNAMASGTQRFLNVEMGKNELKSIIKVFATSQQIHFGVAFCMFVIAETIGLWFLNNYMNIPECRIVAANWVYQFSIVAAIFGIFIVPYNAAIISHEKMSAFAYISIVEAILKLLVAFAIIWAPVDKLIFYAFLILCIEIVNFGVYVFYGIKHFEECRHFSLKRDKTMMKQMLSFSGWTVFGNLGYICHTQGIAIVINMFFSVAVNAAQGIANQVNGIVTQFANNFLVALNPQVVKTYAAGEYEQMHILIIRGCKMAFCLMAFFVIPLVLEAPTILNMWLGIVPKYAVIFMRLVLLISLVNSFSSLLATSQGATGNIKKYQVTLTIVGALHLPFACVAFAFGCGPEYSMYIYLGLAVVLQVLRIYFVCRSVHLSFLRYTKEVLGRCAAVLVTSSVIPVVLHVNFDPSVFTTIMVGVFSVVGVVFSTLFVGLNAIERNSILKPIIFKIKNK